MCIIRPWRQKRRPQAGLQNKAVYTWFKGLNRVRSSECCSYEFVLEFLNGGMREMLKFADGPH